MASILKCMKLASFQSSTLIQAMCKELALMLAHDLPAKPSSSSSHLHFQPCLLPHPTGEALSSHLLYATLRILLPAAGVASPSSSLTYALGLVGRCSLVCCGQLLHAPEGVTA